jgi:hypothetical protein
MIFFSGAGKRLCYGLVGGRLETSFVVLLNLSN